MTPAPWSQKGLMVSLKIKKTILHVSTEKKLNGSFQLQLLLMQHNCQKLTANWGIGAKLFQINILISQIHIRYRKGLLVRLVLREAILIITMNTYSDSSEIKNPIICLWKYEICLWMWYFWKIFFYNLYQYFDFLLLMIFLFKNMEFKWPIEFWRLQRHLCIQFF